VAVVGWVLFLLASLRSPPRLAVALLPLLGILGYLYFTVSYPVGDGDVLKGTYMLSTVAGWAIGFAYALDRLRGNLYLAALALLGVCALVEVPFLVY
jgi:xanthosine utilization system XapX-like protein